MANYSDVLINSLILVLSILLAPYLTALFEYVGTWFQLNTSRVIGNGDSSAHQQVQRRSPGYEYLSPLERVQVMRRDKTYRMEFCDALGPGFPPDDLRISSGPANGIWFMNLPYCYDRDYPISRSEMEEFNRRCSNAPHRLELQRRAEQQLRNTFIDDEPIPPELKDWILQEFKRVITTVDNLHWRKEAEVPLGKCHADNVCSLHRWNAAPARPGRSIPKSPEDGGTISSEEDEEWEMVGRSIPEDVDTSISNEDEEWEVVGYNSDTEIIGRIQCWLPPTEEFLDTHPAFKSPVGYGDVCLIEVQDSVVLYGSFSGSAFLEMNRLSFDSQGDYHDGGWRSGKVNGAMIPSNIIRLIAEDVTMTGLTGEMTPSGYWKVY